MIRSISVLNQTLINIGFNIPLKTVKKYLDQEDFTPLPIMLSELKDNSINVDLKKKVKESTNSKKKTKQKTPKFRCCKKITYIIEFRTFGLYYVRFNYFKLITSYLVS